MNHIVTIVIPSFNSEGFFRKCLVSISNQTFKDYSVVIVDDCSTDNSFDSISEFIKTIPGLEVKLLRNDINIGPSMSRQKGIENCDSEYVCFCDIDDYIDSGFLESMVNGTENYKNDIVFCSYNAIYSNGKRIKHNVINPLIGKTKKEIIAAATDSMCCCMFRRSLFAGLEFPDLRNGEDMALIPVLISKSNSFGYVDKYLYNYVYRANSLSKTVNPNVVTNLKKSIEYLETTLLPKYSQELEFLSIRNYLYGGLLSLLKTTESLKRSKEMYKDFSVNNPKWKDNKYISSLPSHKRVFLFFVRLRMFFILKLYAVAHKLISK